MSTPALIPTLVVDDDREVAGIHTGFLLAHGAFDVVGAAHTGARGYGAALLAHAERRFARAQLRPRVAAAVLGLATGPFRVQQAGWAEHTQRRLELAAQWVASSRG